MYDGEQKFLSVVITKGQAMKTEIKLTVAASAVVMLAACGGGGGGGGGTGGGSTDNDTYAIITPTKLTSTPTLGSAINSTSVDDYGVATAVFAASSVTGLYGAIADYAAATSTAFQLYSVNHLDQSVRNAWNSGWNGAGVTISIIDDFNNASINLAKQTPIISRTADYENGNTYGKVRGTYSMRFGYSIPFTHGSIVSNIAGGDHDGQSLTTTVNAIVESDVKTSCAILRSGTSRNFNGTFYTADCGPNFFIQTFGSTNRTLGLNYKKVAGIAKRSIVIDNNVNLSSSQNPIQTVADIQGHLGNSAYLGVINLSLGSDIPTSGRTFTEVMAQVSRFPLQRVDAVITVAAGNGGAPCANSNLNGCNSVAVALAYQQATAGSTIVVGATDGVGSSENIATYSTRAGTLAQRFVLASGETGEANVKGTSFAAPRVAGIAAIIKQKYPTLTSTQIANVILLSASKDINNDGFDDFSGVSPIYGHGKVSLTRALALAGAI